MGTWVPAKITISATVQKASKINSMISQEKVVSK